MLDDASFLKKVPLFSDLADEDLQELATLVEETRLKSGELLFQEGNQGKIAYVIMEGQVEIFKTSGQRKIHIAVRIPGEVIGEMALLEDAPRFASGQTLTDCIFLTIRQEDLERLLQTHPGAARKMLHTVSTRYKTSEMLLRQSEKMAELGTLTAGIAHELNNPAAAASRGASQMTAALGKIQQFQIQALAFSFSPEERSALGKLFEDIQQRAAHPVQLNPIDRFDVLSRLEEWLEKYNAEEAWQTAPQLASLAYDTTQLDQISSQFPSADPGLIAGWIASYGHACQLLSEIGEGARRISEIVKALKTYVYLDQAPTQEVDVTEGVENTLVILRHKLKEGIEVRREFEPDLTRIQAYASELNQVWTNLIDNAIDAMDGHGVITLRTRKQESGIVVEVEDNGPGIPPELQSKLFSPFFTTKPQGKGTGLGLNTSYNIIHKHQGEIKVYSEPGKTRFEVYLPANPQFSEKKNG